MMAILHLDQARMAKRLVWLMLLLFTVFALIQAIHVHPGLGPSDDSHCSICLVAHATATLVALLILPVLFLIEAKALALAPRWPCSRVSASLFSRPPPALV